MFVYNGKKSLRIKKMVQLYKMGILVWASLFTFGLVDSSMSNILLEMPPITLGKCPQVPSSKNFEMKKFEGDWYFGHQSAQKFSSCTMFNFTLTSKNYFDVKTTTQVGTTEFLDAHANVIAVNVSNPAVMKWIWKLVPNIGDLMTVVETDYDTYAILFFCFDLGVTHHSTGVILTRTKNSLSPEYVTKGQNLLSRFLSPSFANGREKCEYDYPENVDQISLHSLEGTFIQVTNAFRIAMGFGQT